MTVDMPNSSAFNRRQWGWAGTVKEFLDSPIEPWRSALAEHHRGLIGGMPSDSQRAAWDDEWAVLRSTMRDVCVARPDATSWGLTFEYELPLEGGRRPDVVLLAGSAILVLEFKTDPRLDPAAVDQVEAYARDISEYHSASHGVRMSPVLVLTKARAPIPHPTTTIVDAPSLAPCILRECREGTIDLEAWLTAEYAPLPMLIVAARRIFQNEPLPAIKRALSSSVPQAVDLLGRLAESASADSDRVLAFIAGVPGSGDLTMRFKVNGADLAVRGTNWIPLEELNARSTDAAHAAAGCRLSWRRAVAPARPARAAGTRARRRRRC
jgi:hypothetical protein